MNILHKIFPFLRWFPLTGKKVKADMIAGLTVAMVLIPQSMAYAQLAGLPPYYGLYAAFAPVIIGAMWGSSMHLASGPTAMTSLLTAAVLVPFAESGSEAFIAYAVLLSLIVGVIRVLIGFFKLTFFFNFLSQPVIRGFTNAGVLIIAGSQISKIFGIKMQKTDFYLHDLWNVFINIDRFHLETLIVGVLSVAMIYFIKKYKPSIPSSLVVAVLGSLVVWWGGLYDDSSDAAKEIYSTSVKVVGFIPAGLPELKTPNWSISLVLKMIPGALVVMFIGFMEVCSVTKAIAAKSKQKLDLNQEILGQGISSIVGSFFQCYPPGGSFGRSALNYSSGAKTGMSSIFSGIFVIITLLFFTKFLYYLPQATLAAIIIMAVLGLVDFKAIVHAWKVNKFDGFSAVFTFVATLLCAPNMVNGIVIGALVALSLHLYSTMKPRAVLMERHSDGFMKEAELHQLEIDETMPKIRFDGRLYFASVPYFQDVVLTAVNKYQNAKAIVVFCDGINAIDASGEAMLRDVYHDLKASGINLVFVGMKHQIEVILEKSGLKEEIGPEYFLHNENELNHKISGLLDKESIQAEE